MPTLDSEIVIKFQIHTLDSIRNVDRQGNITTEQAPNASDKWKLIGAVEYGRGANSGRIIKNYSFQDILANKVPWRFKNGKARCFVATMDHGTMSIWPELYSVWLEGQGYLFMGDKQ